MCYSNKQHKTGQSQRIDFYPKSHSKTELLRSVKYFRCNTFCWKKKIKEVIRRVYFTVHHAVRTSGERQWTASIPARVLYLQGSSTPMGTASPLGASTACAHVNDLFGCCQLGQGVTPCLGCPRSSGARRRAPAPGTGANDAAQPSPHSSFLFPGWNTPCHQNALERTRYFLCTGKQMMINVLVVINLQ